MPPRISVLMPTYKQASFICRALTSMQGQSFILSILSKSIRHSIEGENDRWTKYINTL